MVPNVDGFFAKPSAELTEACDGYVVQGPQHVLVKSRMTLPNADFDKIHEKVILSDQVFFLNLPVQVRILLL